MSTLREHLNALLALRRPDKTRLDERQFELQGWLLVTAHLDELVALLDQVARPAPCAARFIGGAWQCDHCGAFSLDAPKCGHALAQAPAPEHFAGPREGSLPDRANHAAQHCINCGLNVDPWCNCQRGRELRAVTSQEPKP